MSNSSIIVKAGIRIARLQEAKRYEDSLIDFAGYVWPVVEPAIPFIRGWAIGAIAEHLEAVSKGYIQHLLMNVPPGFMKSLMTDVFWPAWEWGPRNMPHLRYVCASYANYLTERDNMRCRNVVGSDLYRRLWGNRFNLSSEQYTKVKFANDGTGWKLATSVGGIGVGERGDRFIIDDPNNTMEMESETTRRTTNMWFSEVVPTRLNNPSTGAIVIIQQRLHEDDVSGIALSKELGYTHLMIPMEYDSARHCVTVLGLDDGGNEIKWEDPRTKDDQLAWPERFPQVEVDRLKKSMNEYAWAGQMQQTPVPRGGSIIKEDYWRLWESNSHPGFEYILASLDTAFTAKEENDASALTIWGVFRDNKIQDVGAESLWMQRDGPQIAQIPTGNPKILLLWAWQERLEFHDLILRVLESCTKDPRFKHRKDEPRFRVDRLVVEAKANGMSVGHELRRLLQGSGNMSVDIIDPRRYGDKVARVHAIEHLFTDGMIYAPDRNFADMVKYQCAMFPKGSHDDLVDSTSQALRYLRDQGFALRQEEQAVVDEDEMMYRPNSSRMPLYPV